MNFVLGKKILVIGAHPDDEVLGCGGLISANSKKGGITDILITSEGVSAQKNWTKKEQAQRHEQLEEAINFLGANKVFHLKFKDMALNEIPHTELNDSLSGVIHKNNYDYIFTHHPYDVNLDHRIVFDSTLVACRPVAESSISGLFTYFVNSSTEWGIKSPHERFCPTAYLDISNYIDKKLDALRFYKNEIRDFPHPRSCEAVKYKANVFGSEVGYEFAEAFGVIFLK